MKYKRKEHHDFWRMARDFLHTYLMVVRNLSDKTVDAYKQSLYSYLRFLEKELSITDAAVSFDAFNRENVKAYIVWLKQQGYSIKTINLRLTAIKSFLKYCSQEDFELHVYYSEVSSIKGLKEEKKPIEYLSEPATAAILSAFDTKTPKHRRNRMLLILMYDSGGRVQEISDLHLSSLHLNESNPFITLTGKGKKTRNVPLLHKTVQHLKNYLKEFHPTGEEAPLFYSILYEKKCALSTDSISLILKTAANMARKVCDKVPQNVHCHMMRKTKAMDLHRAGVPLPFIMQLLGHESMSTTSDFYAFATLEMMSKAMRKSMPCASNDVKLWDIDKIKKSIYTLD